MCTHCLTLASPPRQVLKDSYTGKIVESSSSDKLKESNNIIITGEDNSSDNTDMGHNCPFQTHDLFVDAFLQNNRLEHMTQVMGYHPKYLDVFLRTQHYMLRGNGPLPYNYRHYIALMVSTHFYFLYLYISQQTLAYVGLRSCQYNSGKFYESQNWSRKTPKTTYWPILNTDDSTSKSW